MFELGINGLHGWLLNIYFIQSNFGLLWLNQSIFKLLMVAYIAIDGHLIDLLNYKLNLRILKVYAFFHTVRILGQF